MNVSVPPEVEADLSMLGFVKARYPHPHPRCVARWNYDSMAYTAQVEILSTSLNTHRFEVSASSAHTAYATKQYWTWGHALRWVVRIMDRYDVES